MQPTTVDQNQQNSLSLETEQKVEVIQDFQNPVMQLQRIQVKQIDEEQILKQTSDTQNQSLRQTVIYEQIYGNNSNLNNDSSRLQRPSNNNLLREYEQNQDQNLNMSYSILNSRFNGNKDKSLGKDIAEFIGQYKRALQPLSKDKYMKMRSSNNFQSQGHQSYDQDQLDLRLKIVIKAAEHQKRDSQNQNFHNLLTFISKNDRARNSEFSNSVISRNINQESLQNSTQKVNQSQEKRAKLQSQQISQVQSRIGTQIPGKRGPYRKRAILLNRSNHLNQSDFIGTSDINQQPFMIKRVQKPQKQKNFSSGIQCNSNEISINLIVQYQKRLRNLRRYFKCHQITWQISLLYNSKTLFSLFQLIFPFQKHLSFYNQKVSNQQEHLKLQHIIARLSKHKFYTEQRFSKISNVKQFKKRLEYKSTFPDRGK
eukprot:403341932